MDIISRAEWGARPPRYRYRIPTPTAEHWLHHAAGSKLPGDDRISDADLRRIRAIQDYHLDVRRWSDIAYSFLMDPDGNVFEGRGAGMAGGHTKGRNTVSHALCVMGNYDTQSVDSDLIPRIVQFVRFAHSQGWTPQVFTGGHRDAPDAETSCPGRNLYSKIPEINRFVLEDVMPSPKDWDAADWAAHDLHVSGATLGAEFGGQKGSPNRKTLAGHVLDIKAMVGALELEGISEAELDERVDQLVAVIKSQPAAFIAKLKSAL